MSPRWLGVFPAAAGSVAVCVAAGVLFGWWLGVDSLTSWVPGWATMKLNTAGGNLFSPGDNYGTIGRRADDP